MIFQSTDTRMTSQKNCFLKRLEGVISTFHLRKKRNRGSEKRSCGLEKYLSWANLRTVQHYEAPFRFYGCCSVQCMKQIDPTLLCVSGV